MWALILRKGGATQASALLDRSDVARSGLSEKDARAVLNMRVGQWFRDADGDTWIRKQ